MWCSTVNIKADHSNNTPFDKFAWNINIMWNCDLLSGFEGDDDEDGSSVHATYTAAVAHEVVQDGGELSPHLKTGSSRVQILLLCFHFISIPDNPGIWIRASDYTTTRGRCCDSLIRRPNILSINPLGRNQALLPEWTCIFIYLCFFYVELHWIQLLIYYQLNRLIFYF